MNNKGQSMALFVIIVPIFILLMAFVVDTGIILKEKTRASSTIRTILKSTYNDSDRVTKISDLLNKNSIPTDNLEIESESDYVTIKDSYGIESIFGKIIGIKEYKIKIYLKASLKDDIVIIEKE